MYVYIYIYIYIYGIYGRYVEISIQTSASRMWTIDAEVDKVAPAFACAVSSLNSSWNFASSRMKFELTIQGQDFSA